MSKESKIGFFEKYLTIWVALCIIIGIGIGFVAKDSITVLSDWNFETVNIPVALLVWLMIYPMMVQIDFSSIKNVAQNWKGLGAYSSRKLAHQTLYYGAIQLSIFLSFILRMDNSRRC